MELFPKNPGRAETVHRYLEKHMVARDTMAATAIAEQLHNPSRPLSRWQVLIPVAAHQEAARIAPALEQYARQRTDEPYSILLSLNAPREHEQASSVAATVAAVDQAIQTHPELDVRYSTTFYESPTIGMIRRDLWNGALLARVNEGGYDEGQHDTIGVNHDIDLEALSPHYLAAIQRNYIAREERYKQHGIRDVVIPMTTTKLSHAPSESHPNISRGTAWIDFVARQAGQSYEAGMVFPFSHYADRGGFRSSATTYETEPLFDRTRDIPGASAQTSPRRYIDRLRYGYDAVWTNETFGSDDTCRTNAGHRPDLTDQELEAILLSPSLSEQCNAIARHGISRYFKALDQEQREWVALPSPEERERENEGAITAARKQLRVAAKFGARVIQNGAFATNLYARTCDTDHLYNLLDHATLSE